MKILFVDASVFRGGAEISLEKIVKYLPEGIVCDIMKPADLDLKYDSFKHRGITFPASSSFLLENKKSFRTFQVFIKLLLIGAKTDVSEYEFIVSNTFKAHIFCLGLKASGKSKATWILVERDAPENLFIKLFKYFLHRSSKRTVFVTNSLMKTYFDVENSVVIENIVECSEKSDVKNRNVFLYAGGLTKSKGFDRALEVFNCVKKKLNDSKMYVAGGIPDYAEKLELELPEGVVNLGYTDLKKYFMESSFLFLFNRRRESFSRICAEAMASGCIIAVLRGNGMDDYAVDSVDSLVFKKYEVEKITDRLLEIASDHKTFNKMSANAVKKANEMFAPEKIINKWKYLLGLPD